MKIIQNRWFAATSPAFACFVVVAFSIAGIERYSWPLFLLVPFVASLVSAFMYCLRTQRTFGQAYCTGLLSIILLGLFVLITALDGLICLLMALPLAAIIAVVGSAFGKGLADALCHRFPGIPPAIVFLLLPVIVAFEHKTAQPVPQRMVTTTILIAGDIDKVWQTVIAFPRIEAEPEGLFRAGIAYPIEARIDGRGVGAIRYCTFSTGSFVEPITTWEPNRLLAFDVTSSPPPMEEFSMYEHVHAAHLHGHMKSNKGQFRLIQTDSGVVLEGTTWYSHEMLPQWYWGPMTDEIIHRIHNRVLEHIRDTVEGRSK